MNRPFGRSQAARDYFVWVVSRTSADKATIINELEQQVWPYIERGKFKPVVYKTFALADARGAHELIDSGTHFGKIVLTTGADLIG
ncbi:zinc-binding dehydrogenase [Paraburkholderia humisilvae]|uniref:Uncharacterized protein n=1 Tax=Paraburkholderia humisilvae TaxID=627669 RepID=A0A6J5E9A2_9BURK|nr:hypothetical protein LMG29542_04501 [Paraburkholderia humisilvae]